MVPIWQGARQSGEIRAGQPYAPSRVVQFLPLLLSAKLKSLSFFANHANEPFLLQFLPPMLGVHSGQSSSPIWCAVAAGCACQARNLVACPAPLALLAWRAGRGGLRSKTGRQARRRRQATKAGSRTCAWPSMLPARTVGSISAPD